MARLSKLQLGLASRTLGWQPHRRWYARRGGSCLSHIRADSLLNPACLGGGVTPSLGRMPIDCHRFGSVGCKSVGRGVNHERSFSDKASENVLPVGVRLDGKDDHEALVWSQLCVHRGPGRV